MIENNGGFMINFICQCTMLSLPWCICFSLIDLALLKVILDVTYLNYITATIGNITVCGKILVGKHIGEFG